MSGIGVSVGAGVGRPTVTVRGGVGTGVKDGGGVLLGSGVVVPAVSVGEPKVGVSVGMYGVDVALADMLVGVKVSSEVDVATVVELAGEVGVVVGMFAVAVA